MITKKDCPIKTAEPYPGIKNRNNPSGSLNTRKEHIIKEAQAWINHFGDSENYRNTSTSNKAIYLTKHLKALDVKHKAAVKLIV